MTSGIYGYRAPQPAAHTRLSGLGRGWFRDCSRFQVFVRSQRTGTRLGTSRWRSHPAVSNCYISPIPCCIRCIWSTPVARFRYAPGAGSRQQTAHPGSGGSGTSAGVRPSFPAVPELGPRGQDPGRLGVAPVGYRFTSREQPARLHLGHGILAEAIQFGWAPLDWCGRRRFLRSPGLAGCAGGSCAYPVFPPGRSHTPAGGR